MTDNIIIKVSTEELLACAEQVKSSLNDMNNRFSSIEQAVNSSNGYWQGEAADRHRKIYEDMKPAVNEIMARLREHMADLRTMASTYEESEVNVTEMTYDLPSDVIV